jgi:hypothetical protein
LHAAICFRNSFSFSKENLGRPMPDIAQTDACWFRGRDRGRINDGSDNRLLFLHSPRRASRTSPLSDPIHHRCDQVLTTGRYHASAGKRAPKNDERLVSASRTRDQIYFQSL